MLSNELGCELGVFLFIQGFSFLSGFLLTDAIQIDATAAKLLKELGHEHHTGHFTNRYQVHFTSPCEFSQPVVVMLLIEKCRQRKLERVAPFNIQFGSESQGFDNSGKGEAVQLLVVIEVIILVRLVVEIKAILLDGWIGSG